MKSAWKKSISTTHLRFVHGCVGAGTAVAEFAVGSLAGGVHGNTPSGWVKMIGIFMGLMWIFDGD